MILRFLFYVFLIYLAYRLVFDFIIPVVRTTRQVKKGFREMQDRMNQMHQGEGPQPNAHKVKPASKPANSEYIDFEEVKD